MSDAVSLVYIGLVALPIAGTCAAVVLHGLALDRHLEVRLLTLGATFALVYIGLYRLTAAAACERAGVWC